MTFMSDVDGGSVRGVIQVNGPLRESVSGYVMSTNPNDDDDRRLAVNRLYGRRRP